MASFRQKLPHVFLPDASRREWLRAGIPLTQLASPDLVGQTIGFCGLSFRLLACRKADDTNRSSAPPALASYSIYRLAESKGYPHGFVRSISSSSHRGCGRNWVCSLGLGSFSARPSRRKCYNRSFGPVSQVPICTLASKRWS